MRLLILSAILLFFAACQNPEPANEQSTTKPSAEANPTDAEATEAELRNIMDGQIESWNSGDIDGFMSAYWENERMTFIGSRGLSYGWQLTLDNYKRAYPDRAAMGELEFTLMEMNALGAEHFHTIGMWQLNREQDTLSGWFNLVWEKKVEGWKIISDHSS